MKRVRFTVCVRRATTNTMPWMEQTRNWLDEVDEGAWGQPKNWHLALQAMGSTARQGHDHHRNPQASTEQTDFGEEEERPLPPSR